jgi:hypothetical protein
MSQAYPLRSKPFKGAAAFQAITEEHTPSQAAVLLSFGQQLRGGSKPMLARAAARKRQRYVEPEPEGDAAFPVPKLKGIGAPIAFDETRQRVQTLHAYKMQARAVSARAPARYSAFEHAYRDAAERVFDKPQVANAADLFALCLDHPKALVRIAAAIASMPLTTRPQHNVTVLVEGLRSSDELESAVAATGLARLYPEHPALRRLSKGKTAARRVRKPPETLMLVHGTWASDAAWYRPRGDFHAFVKGLRPDLYSAPDFFQWSGSYSDGARLDGATKLRQWVQARNEQGLDLMGHSHGANVILKATDLGLPIGKAVLLACPVHVDKYFPNFANIAGGVFSVRVRMDLVILADGGGQRFRHPQIKEVVLPIWFDHGAVRDPQVWRDNNVAQKIGL